MTEQKIYKILTRHIKYCSVHKTLARALKPFIIINPKVKAKEIAEATKKKKSNRCKVLKRKT